MSGIKFSNTTPAAPSGKSLVTFQADGQGNISAAYTAGSGGGGVNSQTSNYTMDATDDGKIVSMNGSSLTVKVPASPPSATWKVFIENLNATALTVDRNGKNIDGAGTNLTIPQNSGVYLATDGSNYFTERGVSSSGTVTHTGSLTADQVVVGNGTADIKILTGPSDATKFLNGAATPAFAQVKDSDLATTDVTSNNVTSTKHGFAPKSPADATKFLNGDTTPAYAQVKDSDLALTNITTNNVSTSKHGFAPILPNVATSYLDGTGNYSVPSGGVHIPAGQTIYPFNQPTTNVAGWAGFSLMQRIPAQQMFCQPSTWQFAIKVAVAGLKLDQLAILKTLPATAAGSGGATVISSTAVTVGSSATPTLAVGTTATDSISLQLDADHDYWLCIHVDATASASAAIVVAGAAAYPMSLNGATSGAGIGGFVSGNHLGDATIPTLTAEQTGWIAWARSV